MLIGGDFNFHEDSRTSLLEALSDLDLVLLNNEEPTHYDLSHNVEKSLDLSITGADLAFLTSWRVSNDLWGNDHYPIFINIELVRRKRVKHRKVNKLYSKKTDWLAFSVKLNDLLEIHGADIRTLNETQCAYNDFVNCITWSLKEATPGRSKTSGYSHDSRRMNSSKKIFPPCPWWNKECEDLINQKSEAAKQFKILKTREKFLYYKMIERVRVGLRRAKKEEFTSFCNNLRKDSNPTYVWKKIECFKNRFNFSETANQYDQETMLIINEQINTLFHPWVPNCLLPHSSPCRGTRIRFPQ